MEQVFEVKVSSGNGVEPGDIYKALHEYFKRQQIGVSVFESRPTKRAADLLPCGHSVDSLGGFGDCNPNGSCLECSATSS